MYTKVYVYVYMCIYMYECVYKCLEMCPRTLPVTLSKTTTFSKICFLIESSPTRPPPAPRFPESPPGKFRKLLQSEGHCIHMFLYFREKLQSS